MTTLRPTASLWRRTRATLLAGSIALGTLLAPGAALADDTGAAGSSADTTTAGYQWSGDSLTDATAWVVSRGGLELRAEPSRDANVLTSIPDGAVVDLRIDETDTVVDGDGVTRWWPVAYGGQSGWVPGQFLTDTAPDSAGLTSKDGSAPGATSSTSTSGEFDYTADQLEGATATVAGNGDSVNVRAEPTVNSDVVTEAADGSLVNLRIAQVDTVREGNTRWWPVEVNGLPGWISGSFLTSSNAAVFPAGSTALVQTESGSGARLRAAAGRDADQTGSVPESATVTIVSGPASHDNSANGWFEVDYNGTRGYVDGDLLVLLTQPTTSATQGSAPTTESSSTSRGTAPATSTTQSRSTTGTQPSGTDNQIPTDDQQAGQTATSEATGTAPSGQETDTPASSATEPTQPSDEGEQPEDEEDDEPSTEGTRPWETGSTPSPTATATATNTPTPTPTQAAGQEVSSAGFIMPVQGATLTQGFGCSSLGFYAYNPDWGCGVHDGVDYAAPAYTPIYAVADGTVVTAGWCDCGLGYYVEIDHGNGIHTLYGHMATQPTVRTGQTVRQGQEIGPVGSTGLSTGPHVHFMVQVNGVSQDPARYLP